MASNQGDEGEVMSQINVTPLVDVLLVLLLVLMVSASAAVARSLDVTLPSAASGAPESSPLSIRVDAAGTWRMGDRRLDAVALRQHLRTLGEPTSISVVIAADGAAEHRHVISLMDLLRLEHVSKLAFAVQASDEAP
jgi:biopolymer transport protein ExbD